MAGKNEHVKNVKSSQDLDSHSSVSHASGVQHVAQESFESEWSRKSFSDMNHASRNEVARVASKGLYVLGNVGQVVLSFLVYTGS